MLEVQSAVGPPQDDGPVLHYDRMVAKEDVLISERGMNPSAAVRRAGAASGLEGDARAGDIPFMMPHGQV